MYLGKEKPTGPAGLPEEKSQTARIWLKDWFKFVFNVNYLMIEFSYHLI